MNTEVPESPRPTTIDGFVRSAVSRTPDRTALIDPPNRTALLVGEPRRLSWSDVDVAVDSVAVQLRSIGAVAVPFPIQHRTHELRHGFDTAGIELITDVAN